MPRRPPAHKRYGYEQAEAPGPVTCAVYLFVALFILAVALYILLRTGVI